MIANRNVWTLVLCLGTALAWGIGTAQEEGLKVRSSGNISYISGGVGASEQQALEAAKADYNLRLLFAVTGSGEFLAGVPVTIADAAGQVVLQTVSDGPYLYARVPAGSYRVSAEHGGEVKTQAVTLPSGGAASQSFYWAPGQ
jgi:hypothetical protein